MVIGKRQNFANDETVFVDGVLQLVLLLWGMCTSCTLLYITPEQSECNANGRDLSPCYTLQQLTGEVINADSVELLLLSGNHLLESKLSMSNFSEVVIQPFNQEQEAVILCQLGGTLAFHNILELKIHFLNFVSCSLYEYSEFKSVLNITKCIFGSSEVDYAVRLRSESELSVVVSNCTFLFNNGSISASTDRKDCSPHTRVDLLIVDTLFQSDRTANFYGGALACENTFLTVTRSKFVNNTAHIGGAIYANSSQLILQGTQFYKNRASSGSSLYLSHSNIDISECHFIKNSADNAALYMHNTPHSSISSTVFKENQASAHGAAIYVDGAGVMSIYDCQFKNNSVSHYGGALYATISQPVYISNSIFVYNEAWNGGAIYCFGFGHAASIEVANVSAMSNSAKNDGGFAYLAACKLFATSSSNFYNISRNVACNGGAIYAGRESYIGVGGAIVVNNTARNCGGALYLADSKVHFIGQFRDTMFNCNKAGDKGGAMFGANDECENIHCPPSCFFLDYDVPKKVTFTNNIASQGPMIYGGMLDSCYIKEHKNLGIKFFNKISEYDSTREAMTSDPSRICLCDSNHTLDCSTRNLSLERMRGQAIELSGAIVDQDDHPKASFIRAYFSELSLNFGKGEVITETSTNCSQLSYHIFTTNSSSTATLVLQPQDGHCKCSSYSDIIINIAVIPCSRGLELEDDKCICDKRLTNISSNMVCDIDAGTIEVGSAWLSYDNEYVRVHSNCPLDYCQGNTSKYISIADPDEQCANNRSKILCGACRDNHSIALGNSKCLTCNSSLALFWLLPVFAVAGIALVALLLVCNMTISHGTLNGLIFYANVVSITGLITGLRNCSVHPILSVFIAWVNLDFGIETCFFSGMDTYQKTWLQFAFPLYIWLLVGAIILVSHYSEAAMKMFSRNNIAVLATLFLLSYAKILKTVVTSLNFTYIQKGSADNKSDPLIPYKVWTSDGNIEYLKGEHLPLFAISLVCLVFLFLPYTLLLTFGQCVRSLRTRRRCVLWCIHSTTFISIMDAYHAPYSRNIATGPASCCLFAVFSSWCLLSAMMTTKWQ